jgi:hypothetical protein
MSLLSESAVDTRIFEELLDAEVFLNPVKLQECARQGVPQLYRSVVYRFLLGVSSTDKSTELTTERMQEEDYAELERAFFESHKKWRGKQHSTYSPLLLLGDGGSHQSRWELSVDRRRFQHLCWESTSQRRRRFDSIVRVLQMTHAHQNLLPCEIDWILAIAATLESLFSAPHETYYCAERLLDVIPIDGSEKSRRQLQDRCGLFLCLFRSLNEDLYLHFSAEELRYDMWLPEMLATLLSANVALDDALRLWDTYLADVSECGDVPLHIFVVLAILDEFAEVLVELDRAGIRSFLKNIPRINVEHVLHKASGFRSEAISRELI